jgi:hypothetical protein
MHAVLSLPAGGRGRWAAVVLALLATVALYGGIALGSRPGPLADLTHFKYWTRLVSVEGLHAAYSGEYPETYAIYPPVTLLAFRLAGALYQQAVDPAFALEPALASHALTVLLRLQALLFHLLVGLAVLTVGCRAAPFAAAYGGMLAYLFNPGVVFDVAQWGQPDPVFGLFVLLALAAATAAGESWGWAGGAGLALALAALAKPQAWVFLPLVAALVGRRGGLAGLVAAGVGAAAGGLWVALPFLLQGTLRELVGLPRAISSVMPVVTANAHNLWWALSSGAARWYLDQEPLAGALSYRLVALGLVALFAGLALLRALREPTLGVVYLAGAYTGFGFFMTMTQIHENHMYIVFPLLAVAAVSLGRPTGQGERARLWALYAILALTWCANMLLHDFDLAEPVVAPLLPGPLEEAQRLNALANVAVFAIWTAWLATDTVRAWLPLRSPQPSARAWSEQ